MPLKLIIFALIILLLVFSMHYAFFRSVIHFFSISRPAVKTTLYTAMIFLSISFITAFFLLHWQGNFWTIWYYRLAGAWMGFLIHFLVAVTITWVIIAAARLSGINLSSSAIATVMFLLAIAGSAFSLWSTFHPRVHEMTIGFKHLPPDWENGKIVQLSDVHLGYIHGKSFAEGVVDRVNRLDPDLILITGDLLDGVNGNYAEVIEPLNRLRARHGIFFITGNHEHYVGIEKALGIIGKIRLRILDNELVNINGLELVGVSYPGIRSLDEIANLPGTGPLMSGEKHPRILLFHTPTNLKKKPEKHADRHFATYWMPDTSFELNKQLHCDLQLSGHTHHGQIFPLNLATRLLFKKYDYGLNNNDGFRIYTTCGTGSWGPPLRSPVRPEIVLIRPVNADSL